MNTFLGRTESNSTCFLTIKQSLPCGCVQFRGACASYDPLDPPLKTVVSVPDTHAKTLKSIWANAVKFLTM